MIHFKKFSNTFLIKFSVILLKSFPTFFLLNFEKFSDVFLIKKTIILMYHVYHVQHYNRYYLHFESRFDDNNASLHYDVEAGNYVYQLIYIQPFTFMGTWSAYISKEYIYSFKHLNIHDRFKIVYHPLTLKQKIDVL